MPTPKKLIPLLLVAFAVLSSLGYSWSRSGNSGTSDNWYLLNIEGQPSGYIHASSRTSNDPSAPVIFIHEIAARTEKENSDIRIETYCENDPYYYLVSATATITKPGQTPAKLTVTVQKKVPYGASKGKMFITYDTGSKQYNLKKDIKEHTVPAHVLIDIIPSLPFQKGTVFEFNYFDIAKIKPRNNHKIDYLGREDLEIDGRIMSLHKFLHKGSGVKETFYWTDDEHQVLRCLRDKKEELLLSTQAQVKQLIPN